MRTTKATEKAKAGAKTAKAKARATANRNPRTSDSLESAPLLESARSELTWQSCDGTERAKLHGSSKNGMCDADDHR